MSDDIAQQLAEVRQQIREHDVMLAAVEGLAGQFADLQVKVTALEGDKAKGHMPRPNPRWWRLSEEEQAAEIGKIRGWFEQIARPFLGPDATRIPDCVWEHPYSVLVLDVACELWGTLWLPERRPPSLLAGQAEYLTRVLPALLDLVVRETKACAHQRAGNGHRPGPVTP